MTKFTKGLLLAMSLCAMINVATYLVPLGVEGFYYRRMGFPIAFWHDHGSYSHFRWIRLITDIVFAGIVSYGFARWYEGKNPRY